MKNYLDRANEIKDEIIYNRRKIHEYPESFADLPMTTRFVMEKLTEMGYEPKEICKSGVVATVGGKKSGKTFLLRADMDALPMKEDSGLSFQSKNENAHTCGHDMHAAMLLGAAKLLKEREDELEGTVKLMFQPDEEGLTGARAMIDAGVLKNPDVDAAMAVHVFPKDLHAGIVAGSPGPVMASQDRFNITITGHGGHGAMPEQTIDPINVGAHIYISLQEIISREIAATDPVVMTIGSFNAGDAPNIIPQTAVLEGTIRAFSTETRAYAKKRLVEICELTAQKFRAKATVNYFIETAPNINDESLTKEILSYIEDMELKIIPMAKMMGSEDFANLSEYIPTVYLSLGAGGVEEKYHYAGNHNPKVIFNEDALPIGAAVLANCAEKWLINNK